LTGIVSSGRFRRNNSTGDETIFRLPCRIAETAHGYQAGTSVPEKDRPRRQPMRAASFVLAFAFVLAGSSMAGSFESGLPGIGTFAYGSAPLAAAR
jgi:hypothetical protein